MTETKKEKKLIWTPYSTSVLLDVWTRSVGQLGGSRKNQFVFCAMSQKMQRRDIDVTPRAVRSKINNMIQKYREEKRKCESRQIPPKWQYYRTVDTIMKSYKSSKLEADDSNDIVDDNEIHPVLKNYLDCAAISSDILANRLSSKRSTFTSDSSAAQSPSQCTSNSPDEDPNSSFSPRDMPRLRPAAEIIDTSAFMQMFNFISMPDSCQDQALAQTEAQDSSSEVSSKRSMSPCLRRQRRKRSAKVDIQWELLDECRNFNEIMANELNECRKTSQVMQLLEAELYESTRQFQNEIM